MEDRLVGDMTVSELHEMMRKVMLDLLVEVSGNPNTALDLSPELMRDILATQRERRKAGVPEQSGTNLNATNN